MFKNGAYLTTADVLVAKREQFRINIRKQHLGDQFSLFRKRTVPALQPRQPDQNEVEFMSKTLTELHQLRDNYKEQHDNIYNCLFAAVQLFEQSKYSGLAFSEMWESSIEMLLQYSKLNDCINQQCLCLIYFIFYNGQDSKSLISRFEQQQVVEYIKQNILNTDDLLTVDYALTCLCYLSEYSNIYIDIIAENDFKIVLQAFKVDKLDQISCNIISVISQALQQSDHINDEIAVYLIHKLSSIYLNSEAPLKNQILHVLLNIIEKIDENLEEKVDKLLETPFYQSVYSCAQSQSITNLLSIRFCLSLIGITQNINEEMLNFMEQCLNKYPTLQQEQANLRISLYWALSNKCLSQNQISTIIQHSIIKTVLLISINETVFCQLEISYTLLNIALGGSGQQCSFLIQHNLLGVLLVFFNQENKQLINNVVKILSLLLQTIKNNQDAQNELLITYYELHCKIDQLQFADLIQQSMLVDKEILSDFDLYY